MASTKSFLNLSIEKKTQFYTLYNAFKAADKQDDRAKTSWKFLCFVYKYLGEDMLGYFVEDFFNNEIAKETIICMIRARAIVQPQHFEKD
jgi:hypothetical protein